jgi:DNA-binding CsgD family transcriptional regulator
LSATIRRASLAPLGRSLCAGEQFVVPTQDGPVTLMVVPLPLELAGGSPVEPLAAVFAGEATAAVAPSAQLGQAIYGLTPAETRLLCALLTGQRLGGYAVNAGISTNTVNAHMREILPPLTADAATNLLILSPSKDAHGKRPGPRACVGRLSMRKILLPSALMQRHIPSSL